MPEALVPDMEQVQGMLPLLLEELLKLAMRPRPPHGASALHAAEPCRAALTGACRGMP